MQLSVSADPTISPWEGAHQVDISVLSIRENAPNAVVLDGWYTRNLDEINYFFVLEPTLRGAACVCSREHAGIIRSSLAASYGVGRPS